MNYNKWLRKERYKYAVSIHGRCKCKHEEAYWDDDLNVWRCVECEGIINIHRYRLVREIVQYVIAVVIIYLLASILLEVAVRPISDIM